MSWMCQSFIFRCNCARLMEGPFRLCEGFDTIDRFIIPYCSIIFRHILNVRQKNFDICQIVSIWSLLTSLIAAIKLKKNTIFNLADLTSTYNCQYTFDSCQIIIASKHFWQHSNCKNNQFFKTFVKLEKLFYIILAFTDFPTINCQNSSNCQIVTNYFLLMFCLAVKL